MKHKVMSIFNPIIKPLNDATAVYFNDFKCGVDPLDKYLSEYALDDIEKGRGVTYLIIDSDLNSIVGYYTLSSASIPSDDGMLSAISIDMFAINAYYQDTIYEKEKQPISSYMLWDIIGNIYKLSKEVLGIRFIVLHSLPTAVSFYENNCFVVISEEIIANNQYEQHCIPMIYSLYNEDI